MSKTFKITYPARRAQRVVGEEHFARSVIGRWCSTADVGEATAKFASAGYKRIERVS